MGWYKPDIGCKQMKLTLLARVHDLPDISR